MTRDDAFEQFQSMVVAHGTKTQERSSVEMNDREVVLFVDEYPCLRLTWNAHDQTVSLEQSHGPTDRSAVFWLDLITGVVVEGDLKFDTQDFSFTEAVACGLDLCGLTSGCS